MSVGCGAVAGFVLSLGLREARGLKFSFAGLSVVFVYLIPEHAIHLITWPGTYTVGTLVGGAAVGMAIGVADRLRWDGTLAMSAFGAAGIVLGLLMSIPGERMFESSGFKEPWVILQKGSSASGWGLPSGSASHCLGYGIALTEGALSRGGCYRKSAGQGF